MERRLSVDVYEQHNKVDSIKILNKLSRIIKMFGNNKTTIIKFIDLNPNTVYKFVNTKDVMTNKGLVTAILFTDSYKHRYSTFAPPSLLKKLESAKYRNRYFMSKGKVEILGCKQCFDTSFFDTPSSKYPEQSDFPNYKPGKINTLEVNKPYKVIKMSGEPISSQSSYSPSRVFTLKDREEEIKIY